MAPKTYPTQSGIDRAAADIDTVASHVTTGFQPLSVSERKHKLKFRRGSGVVATIAALAKRYAVAHPAVDVDAMLASDDAAERLRPLAAHARAFAQLLDDMILTAESDAWTDATVLYGVLRSLGRKNPALATDVKELAKQFKLQKKSDPAAPATATPDAPVAKPA